MARLSALATGFRGRWRITLMETWPDDEYLDLVEQAHITFWGKADGGLAFGALQAELDVRYGTRDGSACAEFSLAGQDEGDSVCGRGWASLGTAGRLVGHVFLHKGDESSFVAERA
jgi:hypothetical protein